MPLPKQVEDAARRAEELQQQLSNPQGNTAADEPDAAPPPDEQSNDQPALDNDSALKEAEHRYAVLDGKYRAEVPRLAAQIKELSTQNQALVSQMEALKKSAAATPKQQQNETPIAISPADIEQYGAEFVDFVSKASRSALQNVVMELTGRVNALESVVERTTEVVQNNATEIQSSREGAYWQTLNTLVPDWEPINVSTEWKQWLGQIDVLSGRARQSLLDDAHAQFDAARVAKFFDEFKREGTSAQRRPQPPQSPPPSRGGNVPPNTPPTKKIWSRADVTKFYDDMRRGLYIGKDEEAKRIDNEIVAAGAEGRIR